MKRVLIITYYWPPSGGSGVQRWLKMSKYLPEYGWQPVIYTPENGEYPVEDPSLEKDVCPEAEVIRRPIIEPYSFYKKFLGLKKEQKVKVGFIDETGKQKGWKGKLSAWIRGNFFIPDARCWWVKPSVRYLRNYLKEHPVDAIISTGPPHSMHLIAMKLKESFGIPWVADFRDPWTEIYYYKDFPLTKRSDRKHHRMEREVLTKADRVVSVTPYNSSRLEQLGAKDVVTIYNGFDREDVSSTTDVRSERFIVSFLGIMSKKQNSLSLWQAFKELADEDSSFDNNLKINLIGHIDPEIKQGIETSGLSKHVSYSDYIPHNQVAQVNRNASVLLILLQPGNGAEVKGIMTGKLFEYLASGRPILCIGPEDGDIAHVLDETKAGYTVGFFDKARMKEVIRDLYQRHLANSLTGTTINAIYKYSRRSLAGDYVKLLTQLLHTKAFTHESHRHFKRNT